MVSPEIMLKIDQDFQTKWEIEYGRFLKKENTLYIWWLVLILLFKKEKTD